MDTPTIGRLALMSIHPQFADAILEGTKRVEFRKRRLAADVQIVVLYATLPVGMAIGAFAVVGYDEDKPSALWMRHRQHAGISHSAYEEYYRNANRAVGILVGRTMPFDCPVPLTDIGGSMRAPQSFAYLDGRALPDAVLQRVPGKISLA